MDGCKGAQERSSSKNDETHLSSDYYDVLCPIDKDEIINHKRDNEIEVEESSCNISCRSDSTISTNASEKYCHTDSMPTSILQAILDMRKVLAEKTYLGFLVLIV